MAANKALKAEVQAEIAGLLEKYGQNYNFATLFHKYEGRITRTTFYRWVKLIDDSGIPAQRAIRKAKKRVARKAKKRGITDKPALAASVAEEAIEVLPAIPNAVDIAGISITEMTRKLGKCMTELETIIAHCKKGDGSIRNAKMMMQAIEGLRRNIETTTRVMETVWDIRRTEQYITVIFNRLRERDPAFIELILTDLKRIDAGWGSVL